MIVGIVGMMSDQRRIGDARRGRIPGLQEQVGKVDKCPEVCLIALENGEIDMAAADHGE